MEEAGFKSEEYREMIIKCIPSGEKKYEDGRIEATWDILAFRKEKLIEKRKYVVLNTAGDCAPTFWDVAGKGISLVDELVSKGL